MELKTLFDNWGQRAASDYGRRQWLLSKWEVIEGIEWPKEKVDRMIADIAGGLQLKTGRSLVDLGCGGGWILEALAPGASYAVGLDFSPAMLRHARQSGIRLPFVCGRIEEAPFPDESFDRALSYFVFLNFMDDGFVLKALKEVVRLLKPQGRALIGQLPDKERSADYDRAKAEYLEYCRTIYRFGKTTRETCRAPQKLFDRAALSRGLEKAGIRHSFRNSFNPFLHPGAPSNVDWRFDLILEKP